MGRVQAMRSGSVGALCCLGFRLGLKLLLFLLLKEREEKKISRAGYLVNSPKPKQEYRKKALYCYKLLVGCVFVFFWYILQHQSYQRLKVACFFVTIVHAAFFLLVPMTPNFVLFWIRFFFFLICWVSLYTSMFPFYYKINTVLTCFWLSLWQENIFFLVEDFMFRFSMNFFFMNISI